MREVLINKIKIGKYYYLFPIIWSVNLFLIFIYKINIFDYNEHTPFIWIVDLFFFIYLLIANKNNTGIFIFFIALTLKFLGSYSVLDQFKSFNFFLLEVLRTSFNYTFPFILYGFFKDITKQNLKFIFNIYKYILLIIFLSIIFGFLFKIRLFETYYGNRFGFSGVLYPSSFSSYFIVLNILILFYYNIKIEKVPIILLLSIIMGFLLGTKTVYLFLVVFILAYLVYYKYYNKRITYYIFGFFLVLFFLLKKDILFYLNKTFKVLIDLYKNHDLITFIFSYRNLKINSILEYISSNWNWYNFFIGGINRKELLIEMSLIDLLLNFGFIGFIFYLITIIKFFIIIPNIFFHKLLFAIFLLLIILAGNFFNNSIISYSLVFFYLLLISKKQ